MPRVRRVRRIVRRRKPTVSKAPSSGRRLQTAAVAGAGLLIAKRGYTKYQQYKAGIKAAQKKQYLKSKVRHQQRIEQSDNITKLPAFKLGTPRTISFEEKVFRVTNPPQLFKRNYQWSSEVSSGRKGWFGIPINKLDVNVSGLGGSLYDDIMVNAGRFTSDTATADATVVTGQVHNSQTRFYVDYLSEKLQMVNSGSNSITGKLKLWAYKRDAELTFTNQAVPMVPINMMMYGSTASLAAISASNEATVGNGWNFNTTTAGVNYQANYDMPGSILNSGGATAQTDLDLDILSASVKDFTGYFFKELNSIDFSLKPGQQINHTIIFNDLPNIMRQSLDMVYIKGTSFYITVEFQAGIVGDATVTSGDNVVSTGSGQLSCILVEKRLVGMNFKTKTKVLMPTPPLAGIAKAAQVIINPDTGISDQGYEEDT